MPSSISKKMNLKPEQTVLTVNAPSNSEGILATLREGNSVMTEGDNGNRFDVILAFFYVQAEIDAHFNRIIAQLNPGGRLWLAYPKKSAGQKTDLSRDMLHTYIAEKFQWDSMMLIALDDIWSAFRFAPMRASD